MIVESDFSLSVEIFPIREFSVYLQFRPSIMLGELRDKVKHSWKASILIFVLLVKKDDCFLSRNPSESDSEAIIVKLTSESDAKAAYRATLLASGFRKNDNGSGYVPCPLGTFMDPSKEEQGLCLNCPPGSIIFCSASKMAMSITKRKLRQ